MLFSAKYFKLYLKILYNTQGVLLKILELQLNEVNEWLSKETETIVKSLNNDAKKLLEDVKSHLDELYEASEKLLEDAEKEMARGSRKTFRRAKFLYKLSGSFCDLIDNVVIPDEIKGENLGKTSEQLTNAMKTINQEKTKWFRALAPYFILSRRRFDASFKRAEDPYQRFVSFLSDDYSKVVTIEKVPGKIEDLQKIMSEVKDYKKNKQTRTERIVALENKIIETKEKLQTLQKKGEIVELSQLDSKIITLTKSIKREMRHLQKPLLKFQALVSNPGYSLVADANSKLDQYMTNPFEALATEKEGYPLLRTILKKIETALNNKKMKLKPSRLRKAKDQINRIVNKDGLVSLHAECKQLFEQKRELLDSGAISEVKDEKVELNDFLKELETKKRLLKAKDARLAEEYQESHKRVEDHKRELETIVKSVIGQKIKIIFD